MSPHREIPKAGCRPIRHGWGFSVPQQAFFSTLLVTATLFGGSARAAECTAPVGRNFAVAPISQTSLAVAPLLKVNQEIDAAGFDVRSLLILQRCQLVFERYKKGIERDDTHYLYGATVAVTSTLVGRLLQEGHIKSLEDPLAALIKRPFWVGDPDWSKLQSIRLVDAMRMRSGFKWTPGSTNGVHTCEADMLREGVKLPIVEKAGTKFVYSDFDAALVGFAAGDSAGKDLVAALREYVYEPMQIPPVPWGFVDKAGRYSGGVGARLRPMDMLKIGQLFNQVGRWNGKQLLPPEFVKATMPMDGEQEGGMGLLWTVGKNPDLGPVRFMFSGGRKTQRMYVFPEWDMVVVLTAALVPEDDAKVVRPLVVALKAMVEGGQSSDAELPSKLAQLVAAGFNGSRSAADRGDEMIRAPGR